MTSVFNEIGVRQRVMIILYILPVTSYTFFKINYQHSLGIIKMNFEKFTLLHIIYSWLIQEN